jgi:3-methyladenine DNA glycosylase AlkD
LHTQLGSLFTYIPSAPPLSIQTVQYQEVIDTLHALGAPENLPGQARYGIDVSNSLGISAPKLRALAKKMGRSHDLALALWSSGIREARILAALTDEPAAVTEEQMEAWARDFASWEVVDTCCCNLFDRTRHAYSKAAEWSLREEEFVKRAAFSLMACLAVHDKKSADAIFESFFPLILRECCDYRNFVRKAINWALRQIGKRNLRLNELAIQVSLEMQRIDCRGAHWVASDALRELRSPAIQARLRAKAQSG